MSVITAKYAGRCKDCGREFEAGDSIEYRFWGGTFCPGRCERESSEQGLMDTDVALGTARAGHIMETRAMFGEAAAAAEEMAWEFKDPDPYY